MRASWLVLLTIAVLPPLRAWGDDASAGDAEGIRTAAAAYVEAFNKHDAEALGKLWAEKAVYSDRATGERSVGRAAIQSDIANVFEAQPGIRLQFDASEIRFIRPEVAQAEATATVYIPDADPSQVAVTAIYVKQGDQWLLDSVEEMTLPTPPSSQAALEELDWLIGSWQDESEEVASTSTFCWSPSGVFLIRSFSTQVGEAETEQGTQVIGWDPRGQFIRSWTFNSDGSFGEAVWSKNGDDWIVKSTQTLADGGAASGTYIITADGADAMSVKLIGHEINGEPQPALAPVRVVRVPDEPTAEATTPATDAARPTGGAQ